MEAKFEVAGPIPAEPMYLHIRALDNDVEPACPVEIVLNGKGILAGPNEFSWDGFEWKQYRIPEGALCAGRNTLAIANTASEGPLGMPPWFMVAECVIGGKDVELHARLPIEQDFVVTLPKETRPIPEPLAEGKKPGFALRGTKGWLWKPEQYLAEIPTLVRCKMNFMMICYGSMCDIERCAWGAPECNRWWEPLPDEKRKAYEEVLRACQKDGIDLCLSMNPNLFAKRIFDYGKPEDLDALWRHYAWMQKLGMKWFCISLDDISKGIDAAGQAKLVNAMFDRLRANDPGAHMIFCPTFYAGDGAEKSARAYLETLARDLDKDVCLFWTGDAVVTPKITRKAAETYKGFAKHRLIVWDNYPVNDGNPTLHLGPVTGRDADLCEVCDGYMSNPMHAENEINRIPLMTCADYAYNPWAYDPARSIGQAILHNADTDEQRQVLKDLVELYPGMLIFGKSTNFNPAIARFNEILSTPHSHFLAQLYLQHVGEVAKQFDAAFPERFKAERVTLKRNIADIERVFAAKQGTIYESTPDLRGEDYQTRKPK